MGLLRVIFALILLSAPTAAFDRSKWHEPIVSEQTDGTNIRIQTPPAGLLLSKKLDPQKRYKLKVIGSGQHTTMRLQIGNARHEYLAAPIGETTRTVVGASRIEILFYSDKPTIYVLKSVDIEECTACHTPGDLRKRILAEAPEIATKSGLDKAIALLKWAANVADYTPNPRLIPADFESRLPEKMVYEFFDHDIGGISCGGHSVFFRHILHLFGIDAFTVNYGIPATDVTHVTVIVPHNGEFYVVDPSFGVTYMRYDRMLGVDEAIRVVRIGQSAEIIVREVGLQGRDIIGHSSTLNASIDRMCVQRGVTDAGLPKCKIGSNSYIDGFQRGNAGYWKAAGVELDNAALFRLMLKGFFSVGPSRAPKNRADFIALLKRHDIPMHPQ